MSEDVLKAVAAILRRDTRTGKGASEVVGHLMDLLYYGEFSIFEQVASSEHAEYINLVGTKGPWNDEPPLWLISALGSGDDPVPAKWRSTGGDPLASRIDRGEGCIYGQGAVSGKVDMILKVLAASRVPADELRRPVAVVGLYGSEAHGTGIQALLDGRTPGGALVGAPTNLELWGAHPGCVTIRLEVERRVRYRRMPPTRGMFELRARGRSAHAQVPGFGVDSVELALDLLDRLRRAGDLRVLVLDAGEAANRVGGTCLLRVATMYDELPDLPDGVEAEALPDGTSVPFPIDPILRAWLRARDAGVEALRATACASANGRVARPLPATHVGWLSTGRDSIAGAITVWTGPGADVDQLVEGFASAVQNALARVDEISVDIRVQQVCPAFDAPAASGRLVDSARVALAEASLPPVVTGGRLTTDAGALSSRGVPTLVFGPGRWQGQLFQDDERVPLAHLQRAFTFYERFIRSWCGG